MGSAGDSGYQAVDMTISSRVPPAGLVGALQRGGGAVQFDVNPAPLGGFQIDRRDRPHGLCDACR